MNITFEIFTTAESYVMMELYNRKLEDVLQHFVNNVSVEQYKTTTDTHIKNATLAFCKLVEAYRLVEMQAN
ncbi:hypothetical protein HNQ91_003200 [Filimonas zeae]|uniref:Uncharacterized protein n=1 Tax=Filimonas zeae TaxID=1737353 RepID=A0A917MWN5_9BACT|nr:hypothetical protein [Filimonas zeae]MDR6340135.1 hypothetical protein [Filimonas zeae]GGH71309.1 hypothetical protein GCM10011379_30520 [Filimonas zeae]